jgi:hypothetical protein
MARVKRGAVWCATFASFALFSVVLLGGMAGIGAAATVDKAASTLATEHNDNGAALIVQGSAPPLVGSLFGHPHPEVCWLSRSQLAAVKARWQTTVTQITARWGVARVYAPSTTVQEIRRYVSGGVDCIAVREQWTYWLPFDSSVS